MEPFYSKYDGESLPVQLGIVFLYWIEASGRVGKGSFRTISKFARQHSRYAVGRCVTGQLDWPGGGGGGPGRNDTKQLFNSTVLLSSMPLLPSLNTSNVSTSSVVDFGDTPPLIRPAYIFRSRLSVQKKNAPTLKLGGRLLVWLWSFHDRFGIHLYRWRDPGRAIWSLKTDTLTIEVARLQI